MPTDDLNYPLARISEVWEKVHLASTMGSAKKRAANGGVLPPVPYPPLEITSAPPRTVESRKGTDGVRKVTTEGGLVIRTVYIRSGVIMDILENKFVKALDLTPPDGLREILERSAQKRKAARQAPVPLPGQSSAHP
jgi:hypothetical protein